MHTPRRIGHWLLWTGLVTASGLVVVLTTQNRALHHEVNDLRLRQHTLHAGLFVPAFRTVTLAGDSVTVGQAFAGGYQVLFVFTTTCPYCLATLPAWERIAEAAGAEASTRVQVLGISLDSATATGAYVTQHGLTFPVLTFPDDKTARLYRADAVPVTVVVDPDGRVILGRPGGLTDAAVDSILAAVSGRPSGNVTVRH